MIRVVLASGNPGKLREMSALLADLPIELVSQGELQIEPAQETGPSFIENALIKARHASIKSGLAAIADDSGLVVDALHGAPGIHSARYAGPQASDAENLARLLEAMAGVGDDERGCRFVCAVVFVAAGDDPVPIVCSAEWQGRLCDTPRGASGFGYDPVFYVPDHGCTSAELEPALKNRLSHRGQAMRLLVERLRGRLHGV